MQFPLLIQIPYLATRSFLFALTLAPLHDNHGFKTETVQCSAGFGNLAPGISSSLSSIASPFLSTNRGDMAAISNQRAAPKTAPAFRANQTSFQDYFEFRNGQWQPRLRWPACAYSDCLLLMSQSCFQARNLHGSRQPTA